MRPLGLAFGSSGSTGSGGRVHDPAHLLATGVSRNPSYPETPTPATHAVYRERPGDCIQVDVKEVKVAGQKCFQYTALDDCTRYRFLRLYRKKDHHTSLQFLSVIRQHCPFAVRKIQVDTGTEFSLAFAVQAAGMRLRYIKPRRPEQNGKVKGGHRIDDEEFWSVRTFAVFDSAAAAVQAWERRYNHDRFSMALDGLTPAEKLARCPVPPGLPSLVPGSEPGPNPLRIYRPLTP